MIITKEILDELSEKAKASPRLRANLDLRNSAEDLSQRMLNALEPGTVNDNHNANGHTETTESTDFFQSPAEIKERAEIISNTDDTDETDIISYVAIL